MMVTLLSFNFNHMNKHAVFYNIMIQYICAKYLHEISVVLCFLTSKCLRDLKGKILTMDCSLCPSGWISCVLAQSINKTLLATL